MSSVREVLFHIENETGVGYKMEDAEFYRTGKIPKHYPDLRPAIREMSYLLNEALKPQKNSTPGGNYTPPRHKYGLKYRK